MHVNNLVFEYLFLVNKRYYLNLNKVHFFFGFSNYKIRWVIVLKYEF